MLPLKQPTNRASGDARAAAAEAKSAKPRRESWNPALARLRGGEFSGASIVCGKEHEDKQARLLPARTGDVGHGPGPELLSFTHPSL
jgi:hypothetical protein